MSGYTPLFSSLTTGTLCGKWPDIGLWPIVLSLSDRHGVVDVTPMYLSSVTGLPVADVIACMRRFCQPDPYSRTDTEKGARLVLIDSHRDWGWRIVNHLKYREKARKHMHDQARVESGQNADRLRDKRGMTRDDPRRPATTRADPPSDTDSYSDADSNKDQRKTQEAPESKVIHSETEIAGFMAMVRLGYPTPRGRADWITGEKQARQCVLNRGATWDGLVESVGRYRAFCAATGTYVMNPAKFFGAVDQPWAMPWEIPDEPKHKTKFAKAMENLHRDQ